MPDQLTISRLHRETPDALGIGLSIPPALREKFAFKAGQFIRLHGEMNGQKLARSYSITSAEQDEMLYVVVKRLADGLFSNYLHNHLQVGQTIGVSAPRGLFYWPPEDKEADKEAAPAHYVAFAAGSGITPIMAVLKNILQSEPTARFTLFYGNRTAADIIFHDALHEIKDMYMTRFECFHLLSQQARDIDCLCGRIDRAHVLQFAELQLFNPATVSQFFICGPGEMMGDIEAALRELSVAEDKIRREKFIAQPTPPALLAKQGRQGKQGKKQRKTPAKATKQQKPSKPQAPAAIIEVIFDGTRKQIHLMDKADNILDAAQAQGLKLPFSCKGGMCSTCRCKLTQGKVTMAANYCLEDWELESGYVLACQSRPETAKITLNFDES